MGLVVMYGHTSEPASERDNYEIGKVVTHCLFIVAMCSRTSYRRSVTGTLCY
jgi:hypothetical protein